MASPASPGVNIADTIGDESRRWAVGLFSFPIVSAMFAAEGGGHASGCSYGSTCLRGDLDQAYIPRSFVTVATRVIATMYAAVRRSQWYFFEVCITRLNDSTILCSRRSFTSLSRQK